MGVNMSAKQKKPDEISRRRRAIYGALLECMSEQNAREGTLLWQQEFSTNPLYALQPFFTRLIERVGIEISRAVLQRKVLHWLNLDVTQLPDDPLDANQVTSRAVASNVNAAYRVFVSFMEYLMGEFNRDDAEIELKIKMYMFDHLHKIGLNNESFNDLKKWLTENSKGNFVVRDLSIDNMKNIFHLSYVAACEYLGPVETDSAVFRSVRMVEQLPSAVSFSPRNFF